ncbi:uncharacterized protein LOC110751233 [Prunus avium]|uniref:Uncharacterized protein LOC110751233 n=2 Tax=Prunus avium TaxID=42229 RepID=A0A6P5RW77_PRUAV|nr:uncharacterized protein LOC110751233 [Prunus avium]
MDVEENDFGEKGDEYSGCWDVDFEHIVDCTSEFTTNEVYRTPLHKPVEFVDAFPQALRSYIHHVKDVVADGHCGYRATAALLGYGEDGWVQVRGDLLNELETYSVHYSALYGSENRIYELKHSLAYFGPDANFDRWMTMPDMGHIIASCYDVVLVHLSNVQCLTFLPLRSRPVPLSDCREIAIGFINRHFVQVFLKPSHPIPPIATNWDRYREPWTTEWATPYITRIQQFIYITRSTVITRETIASDDD